MRDSLLIQRVTIHRELLGDYDKRYGDYKEIIGESGLSFRVIKKYIKCVKQDDRIKISPFNDIEDSHSWKEALQKNEKNVKGTVETIFEKIRKFPVVNKTPLEAVRFIMELQEDIRLQ